MSYPKIDLSSFIKKKEKVDTPRKNCKVKVIHLTPLLILPIVFLYYITRAKFKHMMPLICTNRLGTFKCRIRAEGKITVISTCSSIREFKYANHKLPAHLFRIGTDSFSFYVNGPQLQVNTVEPGCQVDVYLEEKEYRQNFVPSLTWITTSNHKHFTVSAGAEKVLDKIPAVMLEPSRLGQFVAYYHELCHPKIKVEGDGTDKIWVYAC